MMFVLTREGFSAVHFNSSLLEISGSYTHIVTVYKRKYERHKSGSVGYKKEEYTKLGGGEDRG